MAGLISSQRYLDDATVEEKRENEDYEVTVYKITVTVDDYYVIIDGHHSLEAARLDGVSPDIRPVTGELRAQYDQEIDDYGVESWLESHYIDSPYYFVSTGKDVW